MDKADQVALTPANENPWYVLMTLYGEQTGEEVDWELHERNLAAWNAWACQGMSDEERVNAAKSSGLEVAMLVAWPEMEGEVGRLHKAIMLERNNADFAYLGVTSRKVIWLFPEQLWLEFVPVLHRLQGCLAAES